MNLKDIISANLKALRAHTQLSQEEFANKAGMQQRAYGRLENGENWQHLESLDKICKAYDLHVWQLLLPKLDITNPPMLAKDSAKQKEFYDKIKEAAKEISKFQ
jgi:transcriptional regulator with XRE-family HTH domain